jgi:alkaline phosphatase D
MKEKLLRLCVSMSGILLILILPGCKRQAVTASFEASWPESIERTWLGPDFWANRLQDWEIRDGRIECLVAGENRNVNLLTAELMEERGGFSVSAKMGFLDDSIPVSRQNWIGFRLGARGQFDDYRDSAIYGEGLEAGISTTGELFIGSLTESGASKLSDLMEAFVLRVDAMPDGKDWKLTLSALDPASDEVITSTEKTVTGADLKGSIALVSHFSGMPENRDVRSCWFDDWEVSGDKVALHPERAWGPILFSQYTLSRGIVKITAQMAPVSSADGEKVTLEIKPGNSWEKVAESTIHPLARTASLSIDPWNYKQDVPYRLRYTYIADSGEEAQATHEGLFRKDPVDKDEIVVAGLSCMSDLGFPHTDVLKALQTHDPDLLYFAGDQIYERVGGHYELQREPLDKAVLEYLRKWYLFGWTFDEVLRDRPTISIPDDHDVFQGNLWGAGGKAVTLYEDQSAYQRSGGYRMPPEWVKMVERTQTSHLPDPVDPRPIEQGIGVYFTDLNYGGVSFAILEDRKFKSGPLQIFPEMYQNGVWNRDLGLEPEDYDRPGAVLLGDRQLQFLESWAEDWSNQTWMKIALSQTIFSSLSTRSETDRSSAPSRPVPRPGEYPPDDVPSRDTDANGWPQTGRNKALRLLRKGFAFHLAGDQHLGSTIQYGVDEYRDAGYAFCVPAISNIWPRRWSPAEPGRNHSPGAPRYTGDYLDGMHNKVTVYAVANPVYTGMEPAALYDRAPGYGIVRLNRQSRSLTIECWPRFVLPGDGDAKPFAGWPITLDQLDNYGREAVAYLPKLHVVGLENPVVQVIDEETDETVYTLRINGSFFRPKVFKEGSYTLIVSDPDRHMAKRITSIMPIDMDASDTLQVEF